MLLLAPARRVALATALLSLASRPLDVPDVGRNGQTPGDIQRALFVGNSPVLGLPQGLHLHRPQTKWRGDAD